MQDITAAQNDVTKECWSVTNDEGGETTNEWVGSLAFHIWRNTWGRGVWTELLYLCDIRLSIIS